MKSRGFTLFEMLVALVVLGLLMVGAVQGTRFGIASWTAQSRHVDRAAELDGVDHVLRLLLEGIDVAATDQIQGTPDRFTFVGRLPQAFPGPTRQALMTITTTADHRLVLRWQPYRHAIELKPHRPVETALLNNAQDVQFSYWIGQTAAGWQSNVAGTVPTMIRVHITPTKSQPTWPDIVVSSFVLPG